MVNSSYYGHSVHLLSLHYHQDRSDFQFEALRDWATTSALNHLFLDADYRLPHVRSLSTSVITLEQDAHQQPFFRKFNGSE